MKKNKYYLIIMIIISISILFVACGDSVIDFSKYTDYEMDKIVHHDEWSNPQTDEGMVIDGVASEEIWNDVKGNKTTLESSVSSDIKMNTVTYLGDKGIYFLIIVEDWAVYYSPDRRASRNTGAEIYLNAYGNYIMDTNTYSFRLVPTGVDGEIYTEVYILDKFGEWVGYTCSFKAASTVQGEINTSECEGYTIELFVPYKSINLTEKPDYIQYFPAFNHVQTEGSGGERFWIGYPGCSTRFPYSWLVVDNERLYDRSELSHTYIPDSYMTIDGVLDESKWDEITPYSYKVIENNNISITTFKTYFSEKGIYLGFEIDDANAKLISQAENENHGSGICLHMINGTLSTRTSHLMRIFMDGYVRTSKYGGANEHRWYTPSKDNYIGMEIATVKNKDSNNGYLGYTIEAFIPYNQVGLNEKPDNLYFLIGTFVERQDGLFAERMAIHGGMVQDQLLNRDNYLLFNENGYVAQTLIIDDVMLDYSSYDNGFFNKTFNVYSDVAKYNTLKGVTFSNNIKDYITDNNDGSYTLSICESKIAVLDDLTVTAYLDNISTSFNITQDSIINLDGIIDEEVWQNTFTYYAHENGNTAKTTMYTYYGANGLYVAYDVEDERTGTMNEGNPNLNQGSGVILFITDSAFNSETSHGIRIFMSGSHRSFRYFEGESRWYGPGGVPIEMTIAVAQNPDGYTMEIFIPYTSLNLTEKPDQLYLFSGNFMQTASMDYAERYGKTTNLFNARNNNLDYYWLTDDSGLLLQDLYFDNIVFTEADLVNGNYEKTFEVYSDSDKMNTVEDVIFDNNIESYITDMDNGVYSIIIPENEIDTVSGSYNIQKDGVISSLLIELI